MTLSTSAIKTGLQYFTAALLCALFGAVYELFSHSVFSYYMLYAFMIPLVGGALLFFLMGYFQWKIPGKVSRSLWQFGIAALTVGCLLQGRDLDISRKCRFCLLGDRRSISYRRSSCIFYRQQTVYGITDKKEGYFDLRTILW